MLKQYFQEREFRRELGFLKRLAGLDWAPNVLGTTSGLHGIYGIFMMYEGVELSLSVSFQDVSHFINRCKKELHVRGIHHHDLARRNILQRPDGSLVIIDYELAVDAAECVGGAQCPDEVKDFIA